MAAVKTDKETFYPFDNIFYNDQINKVINHILPQFDRKVRSHAALHMFFAVAIFLELVLLAFFLSFLMQSAYLGLALGAVFLTTFIYLIVRVHLQNRKPEKLRELRDRFIKSCSHLLQYDEQIPEHLVEMGNACSKFASRLTGKEFRYYKPPKWLSPIAPMMERFSCWWHWRDILMMKELVLNRSVEEHIRLVRCEPTNLEVHAGLANAYVLLSSLYVDPRKSGGIAKDVWFPDERYTESLEEKFRTTAERAIEEFKILSEYAPNDPWVHAQLAYSYHDLQMPLEEIREYETIVKLCPGDKDVLFKLGVLYFEQGENAKGLSIYEELKRSHYKKAEQLIEHYGQYKPIVETMD